MTPEHCGCGSYGGSVKSPFGPLDFWYNALSWWLGAMLTRTDATGSALVEVQPSAGAQPTPLRHALGSAFVLASDHTYPHPRLHAYPRPALALALPNLALALTQEWQRTAECWRHDGSRQCTRGGSGAYAIHRGILSSPLGFMFGIDRTSALLRSRRFYEAQRRLCLVGQRPQTLSYGSPLPQASPSL